MGFPRQPGEDADSEQDPLSPYSAPTIRRSTDRGSTQPLEEVGGLPRGSGMQVDGADFAGRSQQRRQRQAGAQIYTQRIGEVTQRFDNRMLMYGLGALLVLLSIALVWRATTRDNGVNAVDDLSATAQAAEETPIFAEPAGGAFSTAVPGVDPGTGIGTEPQPVPTTGGTGGATGAFVVAGTGAEGLFLRSEAVSDPANILATLPEGTEVQATGEETNDGTRTWRRIQSPQGEGWVASDFLIPKP